MSTHAATRRLTHHDLAGMHCKGEKIAKKSTRNPSILGVLAVRNPIENIFRVVQATQTVYTTNNKTIRRRPTTDRDD